MDEVVGEILGAFFGAIFRAILGEYPRIWRLLLAVSVLAGLVWLVFQLAPHTLVVPLLTAFVIALVVVVALVALRRARHSPPN